MKKTINIFLIIFSLVLFQNCEEEQFEPSLDYITFGSQEYTAGVDVGGNSNVTVAIYTTNNVGSDTTYALSIDESTNADAGSYVVPSSVTIPAGSNAATFDVVLSDVNLGIGINNLVIAFGDVGMSGASGATTIRYTQNCTEVTAVLDFMFDFYSSETDWFVTDALGGTVASGGGYVNGQGTASEDIVLCAGRDYTLTVTDAFEDGMNDGVNPIGSYTLTLGGVVKVDAIGDFDASQSNDFDTN